MRSTLRHHLAALVSLLALGSVTLALPGEAQAKKCIGHNYETWTLKVERATFQPATKKGKAEVKEIKPASVPASMGVYTELMNSGYPGTDLLVWPEVASDDGKFLKMASASEPDRTVAAELKRLSGLKAKTGCGTTIPFTPIKPGAYVFRENYDGEGKTPTGFKTFRAIVSPVRDRVTFIGETEKGHYTVVYTVTKRRFVVSERKAAKRPVMKKRRGAKKATARPKKR